MNKPVLSTSSLSLSLPRADRTLETYRLSASRTFPAKLDGTLNRIAFSAAHVVADPLADNDPWLTTAIDWDRTIAFREHIWDLGLGVAEAMDTAQRGMGLDWPTSLELIRRSVATAKPRNALVFSGALMALLRGTLLGKGVRALMQSPTGAQLVGINTRVLHPLMFGIGLGLSGVAGALLSMAYTISPSMGEPYTVTALIVITLGGFGSMGGALAGGLLLGVVEAVGMHFTNPSLKSLLSYAVFIGVLLVRPRGLFAR